MNLATVNFARLLSPTEQTVNRISIQSENNIRDRTLVDKRDFKPIRARIFFGFFSNYA